MLGYNGQSGEAALATRYELCQSSKSRLLRSHALAFFSALHARFGTLLAVIHLMFRAFLTACAADLGAKGAELLGVLTFTAHQCGGQPTNVCAVTEIGRASCRERVCQSV